MISLHEQAVCLVGTGRGDRTKQKQKMWKLKGKRVPGRDISGILSEHFNYMVIYILRKTFFLLQGRICDSQFQHHQSTAQKTREDIKRQHRYIYYVRKLKTLPAWWKQLLSAQMYPISGDSVAPQIPAGYWRGLHVL